MDALLLANPLLANLFSQLPSNWGLAAALAAACFLLLRSNWVRQRRSDESTPNPQAIREAYAPRNREASAHHAPEDLLRWQVELHDTARDAKAEIDTKLLALQSLIVIADEHSQRLEALLARAESAGQCAEPAALSGREILDRIENGKGQLPPLDARAQGREILTPAQAKLVQQLKSEEEYTPAQIAMYVGASTSEVEMFLSMS